MTPLVIISLCLPCAISLVDTSIRLQVSAPSTLENKPKLSTTTISEILEL